MQVEHDVPLTSALFQLGVMIETLSVPWADQGAKICEQAEAEIERLRADLESGMERFYSQMAELGNAKAEIERLHADNARLQAEVQYLNGGLTKWSDANIVLEADNERLQAALNGRIEVATDLQMKCERLRAAASAALAWFEIPENRPTWL